MQSDVKSQILEFLKFNGYTKTAEKMISEAPQPTKSKQEPAPKILSFFDGNSVKEGRKRRIQKELLLMRS